jgi:hypothetical protein
MTLFFTGDTVAKRPLTPSYIFFYILFSQETWRILFAIVFAIIIAPKTYTSDTQFLGQVLMYLMVAGIGFAAAGVPARLITRMFKKMVLGDKVPR